MSSEWEISELGKEAFNASRPFSFKDHPEVVFINTGDVLHGKFLHGQVCEGKGLPGQAKKALKKDDVLLTEIRPGNGRYAYVDFDSARHVVSTKFMVIESLGRVIPRFLYHVLTNQAALDEFQRIAESRSGTFPQITFDSISHFPVPTPPLTEQEQLVEFLDALDDRINLLRETNATLEAIAQALFKSWFIDFDPVRAKIEGREPEGMDETTAALFPDSFEESELGLVPMGWASVKFADFITRLPVGKKYDQKTASPNGATPILDQGKSGVVGYHDDEPGVVATAEDPVIVFANHTCYMRLIAFPFSAIQNVLPFRGKGVNTLWAYFATKDRVKFSEYKGHWPDFAIEKAILPNTELTDAFARIVAPLMNRVRQNEIQSETLADLRDTLLPRLISGQLRLSEAEAVI